VNDTLGHAAGDIVIRLASELLRRYFGRGTDIVCRLGGDELLVLTIGIDDVESTNSRLEEFRRTFKQEADHFLTDQLHVTASCGVKAVSISKEGEIDLDSLIEQADALLYQAKRGGKDRVVIDD
jgi:diguanylate cyclase (GGDEF)-like protein